MMRPMLCMDFHEIHRASAGEPNETVDVTLSSPSPSPLRRIPLGEESNASKAPRHSALWNSMRYIGKAQETSQKRARIMGAILHVAAPSLGHAGAQAKATLPGGQEKRECSDCC